MKTKTKLVNANIKSKKELYQRLLDGERFVLYSVSVYCDEKYNNPFRHGEVEFSIGNKELGNVKQRIETKWYDNIPEKGVICWVWDSGDEKRVDIISEYNELARLPFTGKAGIGKTPSPSNHGSYTAMKTKKAISHRKFERVYDSNLIIHPFSTRMMDDGRLRQCIITGTHLYWKQWTINGTYCFRVNLDEVMG